jgi:flagellar biosynthesis/type III secretory pathway protein FliH
VAEVARDVRLFRARLHDAFDSACDALLREFAYAVLGRELVLAPPDIAAIAARIIKEHRAAQPLRMRVAPSDVSLLVQCANELPPLTCDPELSPGDAILELAGGAIDARLGVRLAALLEKQS